MALIKTQMKTERETGYSKTRALSEQAAGGTGSPKPGHGVKAHAANSPIPHPFSHHTVPQALEQPPWSHTLAAGEKCPEFG